MKLRKRVISFILAGAIVFTSVGVSLAKTSDVKTSEVISNQSKDEGYTPLTTAAFIESLNNIFDIFSKATGYKPVEEDRVKFIAKDIMADIYQSLYESSQGVVDPFLILNSIPFYSTAAKDFYKITGIPKEHIIEALEREKQRLNDKGDTTMRNFVSFLIDYFRIIKEFVIYSAPSSEKIYEIRYMYVYEDGKTENHGTGIYYNTETKVLYGDKDGGILNLGYDLEADTGVLYTPVHSWQRQFGFCYFYDLFIYVSRLFTDTLFNYVTKRVKFTYGGKEWMIQVWKGKYFMTSGGEIGVYNRPAGSFGTYYNCASDDELMNMTIQVYHGEDLIAKRGPVKHWWITVFKFGPKVYIPDTLTLYGTVEFPNEEMAQAFTDAAIYKSGLTAERNGTLVSFVF